MKGIGGNITAKIQVYTSAQNSIGEQVQTWADVQSVKGWLDFLSGDSKYTTYNTKIQESTHVFVADYINLASDIKVENSRMVINNQIYDIMLIDNPMGMGSGSQLEIYLKFTGGQ